MLSGLSKRCPEAGIKDINHGMSGMSKTLTPLGYSPRERPTLTVIPSYFLLFRHYSPLFLLSTLDTGPLKLAKRCKTAKIGEKREELTVDQQ